MPYIYTFCNRNPHGTTCARCAALIGNQYTADNRPQLPIHYGCYCYYQRHWVPDEPTETYNAPPKETYNAPPTDTYNLPPKETYNAPSSQFLTTVPFTIEDL